MQTFYERILLLKCIVPSPLSASPNQAISQADANMANGQQAFGKLKELFAASDS